MTNRILIVDDEVKNLDVLHNCLCEANFKVMTAKSGEAALKRIAYTKPKTETVDKVKGLKMSAVDYITKPFQLDEVVARIEKHLTIRNLQKRLEEQNVQLQQEIAERKHAEEKIWQQKQFLESVIESLSHPFYVIDASDYTIEIANKAATNRNLSQRQTCFDLTHKRSKPCDGIGFLCPLVEVKKTKRAFVCEHIHYDTEGNTRYTEVHGFPILDDENNVIKMIEYTLDITGRKQAEDALRENKRKLETSNRVAKLGYWEWDIATNVFRWSKELYSIFGVDENTYEPSMENFADLIHPDDVSYVTAPETFEKNNRLKKIEMDYRIIDQTTRRVKYIHLWGESIRDSAGNLVGNIGTIQDVTDIKEIEKALQEKTDTLGERVKELNCLYGIAHLVEKPGISLEEIIQGTVELIPASWQYPEITCARIILNNKQFKTEFFAESDWKQTSDIIVQGEPVGNLDICYLAEKPASDEGPFQKEERKLLDAITERLGRIIERKQVENALRESECNLKKAQSTAHVGSWELDIATMKVTGSDELFSIFGLSRDEATLEAFVEIVHPDDREYDISHIQRGMEQGEPWDIEHRLILRNGTQKWVHAIGEAIKDENRKITTLTGITQDITEHKQAEEKLQLAKQAADAANQAKSVFLANMSHELRSPLNAILGFAQITARNPTLGKEAHDNLGIINRSGEHLLTLINQVLDLSKIESGRITLNETNFDLYRLLSDLEDMFNFKADDKQLQLIFERTDDLPQYIRTDEVKLRQVLINLLNNAIKFTAEGVVTVRISETANKRMADETNSQIHKFDYSQIQFSITDTGPGIAPDEMDDIFESFVQTEIGRQYSKGTGLGLPISRHFVRLMGGEMTVESPAKQVDNLSQKSDLGPGGTFCFTIQVEVVEQSEITKLWATTKKRVTALEQGQPCYRILIVDDRWTNRQLLIKLLNPLGFELREAENGQQAIEIWDEFEPHLIWMDMQMPVMDGYEATKQIKNHIKGQATTIIALTASAFEEEQAVVLDAGCDGFMRNPFKEADIFEMMSQHIGVQFVYEEVPHKPTISAKEVLTATNLATLPVTLLTSLKEAVKGGDFVMIDEVIEKIRIEQAPVGESLARLSYDFEHDKILDLLKDVQKEIQSRNIDC